MNIAGYRRSFILHLCFMGPQRSQSVIPCNSTLTMRVYMRAELMLCASCFYWNVNRNYPVYFCLLSQDRQKSNFYLLLHHF